MRKSVLKQPTLRSLALSLMVGLSCSGLGYSEKLTPDPQTASQEKVQAAAVETAAQTLTLNGLLEQAKANHPKLRAVQLLTQMADSKVTEKEGAFDPSLIAGSDFLRYNSPTAPGKAKMADDHMVGVQMQDLSGWKLTSGYRRNQGDVKSPDNLTGQGGELFVEFKMPLLRGLGVNEKQNALEQAKLGRKFASALVNVTRLEVLSSASLAYWDWCAACTENALLRRNLELAAERQQQVAARVKSGDLPRIDEVEAQQEVQRRKEALTKSERNVQKTAFKLSLYFWNSEGKQTQLPSAEQAVFTLPTDFAWKKLGLEGRKLASASSPNDAQVAEAEVQSMQLRPELSQLTVQRESVELDRQLAENDRLPILDLTVGPGYDTGFKSVGLTYKVGLQLTVPLANRGPDGRLQAARLKFDKLELDQVLEVQRILTEVRDSASQVSLAEKRLQPALESLRLAQQLEEAERLKFQMGDSTLFLVNQRERATLSEAQKIVEIVTEGLKGQALLDASTGRL